MPTTLLLTAAPGGAHALVAPIRLQVISGPDAGASYTAHNERITIGTHERADVMLHDRAVSRFHCELAVEEGRVVIRDLESRNGTRVNGVSIVHAFLDPGAKLQLGQSELRFELGDAPLSIPLHGERFGSLVGRSTSTRAAFALLQRAAASDATVLLGGETGTGKEAAAESIHAESARRAGPFVIVDCGAIPPQLLESELFGHEKGAFTGANELRRGAFEVAAGGTIFLDEIGELAIDLQPKLLRVLERKQIKRVGSAEYFPVDVRVIAATNRNLRAEVNGKSFRADLYYRLAVVEARLPPLRERREDIPLLVEHILESLGASRAEEAELLRSPARIEELSAHPWLGNVRELRNYVERCLALREPVPLEGQNEAPPDPLATGLKTAREQASRTFERKYLEQLLAEHKGNVSAAARTAGVDRKYLYRLLWRHGLK